MIQSLITVVDLRCVNDQSVPLSFNVIIRRLLCDVEACKLQLPCYFLLPLEHYQRHLRHTGNLSSSVQ